LFKSKKSVFGSGRMTSMFIKFLKDRFKNGFSWEDLAFLSFLIIVFWLCVILNAVITIQTQIPLFMLLFIPLEVFMLIVMAEFSLTRPSTIIYI